MLLILLWHSPSCQCEVGCMRQPWCYYYCSVIPPDVNIRSAACEHIDAFNTALSFHLTSVWGRLYVTTLMLLLLLCHSTWCQCEVGCLWQPWCYFYCSVIPPHVNVRSAVWRRCKINTSRGGNNINQNEDQKEVHEKAFYWYKPADQYRPRMPLS